METVKKKLPRYFDQAMQRMRKDVDDSEVMLAICTENWLKNPLCWAQVGYALLMDKPIRLLVKEGTPIPAALRRAADRIETFVSVEDMELATKRLLADEAP
jgi:hypothetical protein